jgi:hypothetical protein
MENSVPLAGSGLIKQKIPTLHHPEGIDPEQMFFQEEKVHDLILSYQRDPDPETWQRIVTACLPLIDSLIRKFNFQVYEELEVLRNECVIKLHKAIRHYNPERGRAFSVITVALQRFLFSSVATIRTRTRRFCLVPDEELAQYESAGQTRTQLPEELKAKIAAIRTRFTGKEERAAFKFLINYFLLEGLTQPRKQVLETLRRQFGFPLDKAAAIYDYTLVALRSQVHAYYSPVYSTQEILRLCYRSSVLPEIHGIVGEQCFAKLMDVFAGITVTFPSKPALEKMRKSQAFLNGLNGAQKTVLTQENSLSSDCSKARLLHAVFEGHHTETPLYASEET